MQEEPLFLLSNSPLSLAGLLLLNTLVVIFLRYLLTGITFDLLGGNPPIWKQLHQSIHRRFEFKWSLINCLPYGTLGTIMCYLYAQGHTKIYHDPSRHGWLYLLTSILFLFVAFDSYYYFVHRILHWRPLMRRLHWIHHSSIKPSVWAIQSFHPVEPLLLAGILPILPILIPINLYAFLGFLTLLTIMDALGHSDADYSQTYFRQLNIKRIFTTTYFHQRHHSHMSTNYGLFFTFWDRLLGSEWQGKLDR